MSSEENAIEIPIEFSIQDKREIDKEVKKVEKAEQKLKKIKDKTSKQAIQTGTEDERGGIFGGARDVKVKIKDKTSKAPVQRQNEFKKLRDKVNDLEDTQKKVNDATSQLKEAMDILPLGGTGGLQGFASKFAPFMAQALIAVGFIKTALDELLRDGGWLDRRLKILIEKQHFKLTRRREQAELNRGFKTLRVTSSPGLRGPTSQIFNSQQLVKRGLSITDENQEALAKNLL